MHFDCGSVCGSLFLALRGVKSFLSLRESDALLRWCGREHIIGRFSPPPLVGAHFCPFFPLAGRERNERIEQLQDDIADMKRIFHEQLNVCVDQLTASRHELDALKARQPATG